MNIQPIILAAGKGTRMGYNDLPKVLVPIKNKPMILYLVEQLDRLALSHKPIVVVGHKYTLVQAMLGPRFIYAFQEGQLGTAHATAAAQKHVVGENVLVLYGDMPFVKSESLKRLIIEHLKTKALLSMFTTVVPNFENEFFNFYGFGRIIRSEDNQIVEIKEFVDLREQEKKVIEVNPGIYIFSSNWLWENVGKILKNKHGEYYLTDIIAVAKSISVPINSLSIDPYEVFGVNTPAHLQEVEQILQNKLTKK